MDIKTTTGHTRISPGTLKFYNLLGRARWAGSPQILKKDCQLGRHSYRLSHQCDEAGVNQDRGA